MSNFGLLGFLRVEVTQGDMGSLMEVHDHKKDSISRFGLTLAVKIEVLINFSIIEVLSVTRT